VGQREGRVLRDQALQSRHGFGEFSLVFQGFGGGIPVIAGRHRGNLLAKKSFVAAV
jgi:hypothetical protein